MTDLREKLEAFFDFHDLDVDCIKGEDHIDQLLALFAQAIATEQKALLEKVTNDLKNLKTNHTTYSGDIWEHLRTWDTKVDQYIDQLSGEGGE